MKITIISTHHHNIYLLLMFLLSSLNWSFGQATENLQGHYIGDGKIIVNWCNQKRLSFDMNIDNFGTVTGKIGDATIHIGHLKKNTWGPKKYLIIADLDGYLVEEELIRRKSIKITLNVVDRRLIGGFGTSGFKIGEKKKMILSGSNLVLEKQ